MDNVALHKAVKHFNSSRTELAKALSVTPSFVSQLFSSKRPIPIEQAFAIERATKGAAMVEQLRPDIDFRRWRDIAPKRKKSMRGSK